MASLFSKLGILALDLAADTAGALRERLAKAGEDAAPDDGDDEADDPDNGGFVGDEGKPSGKAKGNNPGDDEARGLPISPLVSKMGEPEYQDAPEPLRALVRRAKENEIAELDPKSLFFDPMSIVNALGYKDKPSAMTYSTLRAMSLRCPVVAPMIKARITQVSNFATPVEDKFSLGFRVRLRDRKQKTTPATEKESKRLTQFMQTTGNIGDENAVNRDNFETFLKKITKDSLIYDQCCHPAGTLVEVENGGQRAIEALAVGDLVRTHTGELRPVVERMTRSFSGDMVHIRSGGQRVSATASHPVLTVTDPWFRLSPSRSKGTKPTWIAAADVRKGHYLVYPKPKLGAGSVHSFNIFDGEQRQYPNIPYADIATALDVHVGTVQAILCGYYKKRGPVVALVQEYAAKVGFSRATLDRPAEVVADEAFARLCGLYAAEGNVRFSHDMVNPDGPEARPNAVAWTFHLDEAETLALDVVETLDGYGVSTTLATYDDRQALTVIANSADLARFFLQHFGTGSAAKRVPRWIFESPCEVRHAFARAYLEGDGHIQSTRVSFSSTSLDLFGAMRVLLADVGAFARHARTEGAIVNGYVHAPAHQGNVSGPAVRALLGLDAPTRERSAFIQDDEFFYIAVTEVTSEAVEQLAVFNVEVAEDHSYIANGFASHNCFEVQPARNGKPYAFYAVDAATIRIADSTKLYIPDSDLTTPRYVQVYDGMTISTYSAQEMCFAVRNPSTTIGMQGYGLSELEVLVKTVTASLWAFDYNQKFFCMAPGSHVTTSNGLIPIERLVDTSFMVKTASGWTEARAVKTGDRPKVRTLLWNGLETTTSPEHRFFVIPEEGSTPEWREQQHLKTGDMALVGYHRSDPDFDYAALKVGHTYETDRSTGRDFLVTKALVEDEELWEFLGFALGDGYFPDETRDTPAWIRVFPHFERDGALFDRFLAVCERHGIHAERKTINKHHERVTDGEFGYPCIQICHEAFREWLTAIGFCASNAGKRIPSVVYQCPAWVRDALLRGLFSADGHARKHVTGYVTPEVHSSDPEFCRSILECLWSCGVASSIVGEGWDRHGTISVQDIEMFLRFIRYLQEYKNSTVSRSPKSRDRWDRLHPALQRKFAAEFKTHSRWLLLPEGERCHIGKVVAGTTGMSRPRALHYFQQLGEAPPPWLLSFVQVPIDCVDEASIGTVGMFDVEVFDDAHLFFVNHVAVHNSQGTSAKGVLNIKGNIPEKHLKAFRQHWYTMVAGIENSFKTPILNADDAQWLNMQSSNRDMEFSAWMDFLIKIIAAMYDMDPMEINFKYGDSGGKSMFESSNQQKLTASKDKGLKPLLRFIAQRLNSHVIYRLNPDFEIDFVGLEAQTAQEAADLTTKLTSSIMTIDEARAQEDLAPLPNGAGAIIRDPVFLQHLQAASAPEQPPGDAGMLDTDPFASGNDDEGGAGKSDDDKPGADAGAEPPKPNPFAKALPPRKAARQLPPSGNIVIDVEV